MATVPSTRAFSTQDMLDELNLDTTANGLRVNDVTGMLKRLGSDVPAHQQLREFIHNAIQATALVSGGTIIVDYRERNGAAKLAFIDTGAGMTARELRDYVGQLSSSGGGVGDSRFGIGAKIAGLTNNSLGLEYTTLSEGGVAVRSTLGYNQASGEYEWLANETGEVWAFTNDVPKEIKKAGHGTMVVLLGDCTDENTFVLGCGITPAARKFETYLNSKYAVIPNNIRVSALLVGADGTPGRRRLQRAAGLVPALEEASKPENQGVVSLPSGKVRWYYSSPSDEQHGAKFTRVDLRRIVAICLPDEEVAGLSEIYDFQRNRTGQATLANFGLAEISSKVALVIEPSGVRASSTRDGLREQGSRERLDLSSLAVEFRAKMPARLATLITESANANSVGHDSRLTDWLKRQPKVTKARKSLNGVSGIAEGSSTGTGEPTGALKFPKLVRIPDESTTARKATNTTQGEAPGMPLPQPVAWTPEDLVAEPHLASFAGRFDAKSNTLFYNPTWSRIDQEVADYTTGRRLYTKNEHAVAHKAVLDNVIDRMREAILTTQILAHQRPGDFSEEGLAALYSEYGLTPAACSTLSGVSVTKYAVSAQLGKE